MQLIRSLDDLPARLRSGAVTIGNFDGVHRGHARIIQRLIDMARRVGGPAVVFTFDPHPVRILRPDLAPPPLTWTDRKAELMAELGVDSMVVYPTDEALLALEPAEFFDLILRQRLDVKAVVEGPNFFFGHNRTGTIAVLERLCRQAGVALEIVPPLIVDRELVCSSRVRAAIQRGDVALARRLLTQPYRIRGMVTHGAGRGVKLGFPTANVDAVDTLLPALGVYAGQVSTNNGVRPAAINVGPNPTFGESVNKVEVHLLDFQDSLYGRPLEVDFLARLRDIQPFGSVENLKEQLQRDVQRTREIVGEKVVAN